MYSLGSFEKLGYSLGGLSEDSSFLPYSRLLLPKRAATQDFQSSVIWQLPKF